MFGVSHYQRHSVDHCLTSEEVAPHLSVYKGVLHELARPPGQGQQPVVGVCLKVNVVQVTVTQVVMFPDSVALF